MRNPVTAVFCAIVAAAAIVLHFPFATASSSATSLASEAHAQRLSSTDLEIAGDMPTAGAVVVPIGGGGQISGIALALAALSPATTLIGVEPAGADDAALSLRSGTLQSLAADPQTIAEGVKSKSIGNRNFEVIVGDHLVRDIVIVTDDELKQAVRVAWTRLKLAVEPTGALALAAYLSGRVPAGSAEHPTVLVLSGGNFDPATMAQLLSVTP